MIKRCLHCGAVIAEAQHFQFKGQELTKKFCSPKCRVAFHRASKKAGSNA